MKIGDKVTVCGRAALIEELVGKTGTIIEERIPESQSAMLAGITNWIVRFDVPVRIRGSEIKTCGFRETELKLIN